MRVLMNVDANAGGCRCRCGWWMDAGGCAGGRWMRVDVDLAMRGCGCGCDAGAEADADADVDADADADAALVWCQLLEGEAQITPVWAIR